ncbi:MAG: response regulator transcription factor [Planctomycetota bacterium]
MSGELEGRKILLVDDDADIVAAMRAALKDTGAEVSTAGDGDTAVRKIASEEPDLVVLDMMLPKRSGFLVIEHLRDQGGEAPEIIMITGNEGTRHRIYAESLGVAMYINKPFRMERLIGGIKTVLGEVAS